MEEGLLELGPVRVRSDAYRERHSKANRRRAAASRGDRRSDRPGRSRHRDKSESDESEDSLHLARIGLKEEFSMIRQDRQSIMDYVRTKNFENIVFEESPDDIRFDGIQAPTARPCPDGALIDGIRQMSIERWSKLHLTSQIALAKAGCNPNFMCTVLPSFEGRLRHLKKYDRNDPPPPPNVRKFFSDIYSLYPRGEPDVEYFQAIDEGSHVEAFRERWSHVLHKSAGVDGEKLCGCSASKAAFLDEEGSEAILAHAMQSARQGCFFPELMRAAGRAKVMTQDGFVNIVEDWLGDRERGRQAAQTDSEPEGEPNPVPRASSGEEAKTMDRLIWISPPSSLHVSTPGARTLSRGVKEAQVSTYGISPFRGGAQKLFQSFGYLGPYTPTYMQRVLSGIGRSERNTYNQALQRDRAYHNTSLFGMGSDVRRMDSSMRQWWIQIWGQDAYQDFPLGEIEKENLSQALIDVHCGGKLAMDGKLTAEVNEGATTGAVGVSTLESAYRWNSDLLGVTFNLQREIVNQLRRTSKRGGRVDERTADLAGRDHGLSWMKSERVEYHPSNRPIQLGEREIQRKLQRFALNKTFRQPRFSLYPPLGPGTPLFDALLPIVGFYYCTVANGDDDWNTFPLLEYVKLDELPSILDPCARLRWLASSPKTRQTPEKIISNQKMEEAATMLRLPTVLNSEKGVEGRGLESFLLNSLHPLWSDFDKSYSFFIESTRLKDGLLGLTHPDDVIRSAAHSVLRLVGLVFNHPDPRVYEIYEALANDLADRHDLHLSGGYLNVADHLAKEKHNSLYHVMGPGSIGSDYVTELKEGKVRFPKYHEVLEHHGFSASADYVRNNLYTVEQLLELGFPQER